MANLKMEARKALFTGEKASLWEIGETVFIRTVTYHLIGRVIAVLNSGSKEWLVLEECIWVADSGKFTDAIDNGKISEYEVVSCPVRVNTDSITDVFYWPHPIPTTSK